MKKNKKRIILIILSLLLFLLIIEGLRENRQLEVEDITISSQNMPKNSTLRIAHLSDLQFPRIRIDFSNLFTQIENYKPDIVFITGDSIDQTEHLDDSEFTDFINHISNLYPTYIINGNQELTHPVYTQWEDIVSNSDATYLENNIENITIEDYSFNLVGLSNNVTDLPDEQKKAIKPTIDTLVLAHHPEEIDSYIESLNNPLAVFSGHARGGQVRIPGLGGLYSPNQGLFPTYTSGDYLVNNTHLILSRGLSNSVFPLRINNYPHLILTTIVPE